MTKKKEKYSAGDWKIGKEKKILYIYSQPEGLWRTICEFPAYKSTEPKEVLANAKLISQAKNNFKLLQQLESIYSNKKQVSGLNGFEVGILISIQEQIKKSI